MDFTFSEEQTQLRKHARVFAEQQIRPVAAHYDSTGTFPWEVLIRASEAGLYGQEFFERQRQDVSGMIAPIVSEELAWGCGGIALALLSSRLPYYALMVYGTQGQVDEWGPVMFGTPQSPAVAAFALTEPEAGSDVSALRTTAVRDGGDWVLDGRKAFVTNGGIADVHVVVATVDPSLGSAGHALFLVRREDAGFEQAPKDRKLGVRASHTCEIRLRELRIPADRLLGDAGDLEQRLAEAGKPASKPARSMALRPVEMSRPLVAAQAVGVARAALEFATGYAHTRTQFGRPLFGHGSIRDSLAGLSIEVDAARMLVYRASQAAASGAPEARETASAAKFKAASVASEATDRALRILGGRGYLGDYPVEKWCRDARVYAFLEGTSEIQLQVVSRALAARMNSGTPDGNHPEGEQVEG